MLRLTVDTFEKAWGTLGLARFPDTGSRSGGSWGRANCRLKRSKRRSDNELRRDPVK